MARNCDVRIIDLEDAQKFIKEHHRQGTITSIYKIQSLGIFFQDTLVGVAQFSPPSTKTMRRKYSNELLRLTFPKNVRVVGGASKLLSHYKKLYHPTDIFTCQDISGEMSEVYTYCGFKLAPITSEDKTIMKTGYRIWEWFDTSVTFYTYKITATDSEKYYFGVRKISKAGAQEADCLADPYMGSGSNHFQQWKTKHIKYIKKEIVKICSTRAEAFHQEKILVGDLYKTDPNCLNLIPGGIASGKTYSIQKKGKAECPVHGQTAHAGKACMKCATAPNFSIKDCKIHGACSHIGYVCQKCQGEKITTREECVKHGLVKHQHGVCLKCRANDEIVTKYCKLHGDSLHRGEACYKCTSSKTDSLLQCDAHGLTKHRGGSCFKCSNEKAVKFNICPIHGDGKFLGDSCYACVRDKSLTEQICSDHGKTIFRGKTCLKCSARKMTTVSICDIHGETKFQWNECTKCRFAKSIHKRKHLNSPNILCILCNTA